MGMLGSIPSAFPRASAVALGGDHVSEAVPVFIISAGRRCDRYFLCPSMSREKGWKEAWRPTRRLLSLTGRTGGFGSSKLFHRITEW